ncbi:MAG: TRAP transporter fused permease subunit [Hyphomicrobiales bacterium]|nr:TRAP transporter fused permease subunit [Hyphomicrobiales bacterium]
MGGIERFATMACNLCLAAVLLTGIGWILSLPDYLGLAYTFQQVLAVILGIATAATLLRYPYGSKPGIIDIVLALAAFLAWLWMAWNFEEWMVTMADRTPDKWLPGAIAIVLMMEGMRKATGRAITILVWIVILYAFFGDNLPGVLQAEVFPPSKVILFLYADNNGIPGLVLRVVVEMVVAFIILGKVMEVSGATKFFTDLSLALMGHRRGGPAKVAVLASSAFGTISGSTVGNIMSTGIVTIPLMKRTGFQPRYAAAIEAVASNGGQFAPPVMGATAFIIAEFLEVPYSDVVIAAAVPALLYYLVLFLQVDALAKRYGLMGLPKSELPKAGEVLWNGWIFLVPLGILIYFLFGLGYNAGKSALYSAFALFLLAIVRLRRLPTVAEWKDYIFGGGESLLPLILIAGGAGVVIGVLNSTGLAFQLSLILTTLGENHGVVVMLLLTAVISIILGMGMPTAAIYIVLATVIAPALVEMKITPMAAHLFLFYFGLLSMLTPPVAVASMVAAGLAGADMWRTGIVGVLLASSAYLLPFFWVFNPAILLDGSVTAIALAILSVLAAALMLAQAAFHLGQPGLAEKGIGLLLFGVMLAIGSSTLWLGPENFLVLIPTVAGYALVWWLNRMGGAHVILQQAPG